MNVRDEMRIEASRMADGDIAAILEIALRNMSKGRWMKLRRNEVEPQDEKERAYMSALSTYVYHKLALRRELNFYGYAPHRMDHEIKMNQARNKMDRIEMGVPEAGEYTPTISAYQTVHDSIEVKLSPKEAADLTEAYGKVHRTFSLDKIEPRLIAELLNEPVSKSVSAEAAARDKASAQRIYDAFRNFPPINVLMAKAPDEGYVLTRTGRPVQVGLTERNPCGEVWLSDERKLIAPGKLTVPLSRRLSRGEIKGGGEV